MGVGVGWDGMGWSVEMMASMHADLSQRLARLPSHSIRYLDSITLLFAGGEGGLVEEALACLGEGYGR